MIEHKQGQRQSILRHKLDFTKADQQQFGQPFQLLLELQQRITNKIVKNYQVDTVTIATRIDQTVPNLTRPTYHLSLHHLQAHPTLVFVN